MARRSRSALAILGASLLLACSRPALAQGTTGGCTTCVHGLCTQDYNTASYSCSCSAGWTGGACNVSTAPAPAPGASSACGTCVNGVCSQDFNSNSYSCSCSSGWQGSACNVSSAAAPAPASPLYFIAPSTECQPGCANNGSCGLLANGSSVCDCSSTGYTGPFCSVIVGATPQQTWSAGSSREPGCEGCANGARCVQTPNSQSYYCECSGTGYSGANCTQPAQQAVQQTTPPPPADNSSSVAAEDAKAEGSVPKSLDAGAVVGIILAVAVVLGLAVVGVMLWRQPRKRGSKFQRFDLDTEIPSNTSSRSSF